MSELHKQESEFSRLLQRLPPDDLPRPEHADYLRKQMLARYDRAKRVDAASPWWKYALLQGSEIMRRPVSRLIVATAACLILAAWLLLPGGQSDAWAFNRIVATIAQAKTARFKMEVSVEGQPKQTFQAWFQAPAKYRQEVGAIVNIVDLDTGKFVTLIPQQKMVMVMNMKGTPKGPPFDKIPGNYFDEVRRLLEEKRAAKNDKFERLPEKEFDGKKAVGFRSDTATASVTLWGDPKTGLPVRIESVWSGIPHTEVIMTDFQMNVELKASLFDQTPPADYKVQSIDVDASEPREQDLVTAFKTCAEISAGDFPDAMDTVSVQKLVIKFAMKNMGKNVSDEKIQGLMKDSIKIGRGFQFALQLPESAEATYAGKDAKQGERDRPIFWYKPQGATKYRVIFADLAAGDADAAPKVAGAKRIEKAGKTHKPADK
jgi:outer membrane lipoprotein-sorting protein